ncbi:MAG: hypothetical protein J6B97_10815 [Bacteroidales bacterium]|nr:hypothetical protein [Bacteroidales bacterium]
MMKLTPNEQKELNTWLAEGNSENSNPWYMTDESGKELDFVSAMRTVAELAAEHTAV